jgi:hypothetical protein
MNQAEEIRDLAGRIERSHVFIDSLFEAIRIRRQEVVDDERRLFALIKEWMESIGGGASLVRSAVS